MKCCGVDGYTDFLTYAKNWDRTPGSVSPEIDAPLVCCKTAGQKKKYKRTNNDKQNIHIKQ
jgi:hypothetical protein